MVYFLQDIFLDTFLQEIFFAPYIDYGHTERVLFSILAKIYVSRLVRLH